MRRVFADAVYWVALAHRRDQWHARAVQVSQRLGNVPLVTTDEVLNEFLAHFSAYGSQARDRAARTVRDLLDDPGVAVIAQSRQAFLDEVLTHDDHFAQEGFACLL